MTENPTGRSAPLPDVWAPKIVDDVAKAALAS